VRGGVFSFSFGFLAFSVGTRRNCKRTTRHCIHKHKRDLI
jgi:hypothetical protein